MIEFLNTNSGLIQAISTVILVIVTGIYVWLTGKNVKILQKSEEERNRPRVILYIQQREDWLNFVNLIIGNYGLDVAREVKFSLSEDLKLLKEDEKLSNIRIIKNGVKNLIPQQILKIPLLSLIGRVEELSNKNIKITAQYKDSNLMRNFSETFQIDFNSLIEHQIGKPPIYEISENIKKIANSLDKVERKINK